MVGWPLSQQSCSSLNCPEKHRYTLASRCSSSHHLYGNSGKCRALLSFRCIISCMLILGSVTRVRSRLRSRSQVPVAGAGARLPAARSGSRLRRPGAHSATGARTCLSPRDQPRERSAVTEPVLGRANGQRGRNATSTRQFGRTGHARRTRAPRQLFLRSCRHARIRAHRPPLLHLHRPLRE